MEADFRRGWSRKALIALLLYYQDSKITKAAAKKRLGIRARDGFQAAEAFYYDRNDTDKAMCLDLAAAIHHLHPITKSECLYYRLPEAWGRVTTRPRRTEAEVIEVKLPRKKKRARHWYSPPQAAQSGIVDDLKDQLNNLFG